MAEPTTPTADSKAEPATNNPVDKPTEAAPSSASDVKPVEQPKVEEKTVPLARFSEVNAELKTLRDAKAADEKKALEDQGKWKELAEANEAKAKDADGKFREAIIQNNVFLEANKLGIVDPDAAAKLLNRANVQVGDDGSVTGVEDALKALIVDKPYLVTKETATRIGSGSNPSSEGNQSPTATIFKKSEMQDPKFYKEHRTEILAAIKSGNVIDDTK